MNPGNVLRQGTGECFSGSAQALRESYIAEAVSDGAVCKDVCGPGGVILDLFS